MNEELDEIIENFTSKQKKFITQFEIEFDSGRSISNQELELRTTVGKNSICSQSTYYDYIPTFVDLKILSRDESSSKFIITDLGWKVWNKLKKRPNIEITDLIKTEMESLLYRMASVKPFNRCECFLKSWTEKFAFSIKKLLPFFKEVVDENKRDFINSLALILWNNLYQPELVSQEEFSKLLNIKNKISDWHIFLICKQLDTGYFLLDDNLWFICQYYNFWKDKYQELIKFYLYKSSPEELIQDSQNYHNSFKEFIKEGSFKIYHKKAINKIAEKIIHQYNHFLPQKYKISNKWLYPRLKALLMRDNNTI